MGLGVNPKLTYVTVEYIDKFYLVAENLVESNFKTDYLIVDKISGSDLSKDLDRYQKIFKK